MDAMTEAFRYEIRTSLLASQVAEGVKGYEQALAQGFSDSLCDALAALRELEGLGALGDCDGKAETVRTMMGCLTRSYVQAVQQILRTAMDPETDVFDVESEFPDDLAALIFSPIHDDEEDEEEWDYDDG